jgi:hypothetical protein
MGSHPKIGRLGEVYLSAFDITLVEVLIFALSSSFVSALRPDAPPPALLAPT